MTTHNLASPVIIRPKHGEFKGVPLVAVRDGNKLDDVGCFKCVAWKRRNCGELSTGCLGIGCEDGRYHYEYAEGGKHDKG